MPYPYLAYHLDKDGLETPSDPAQVPDHGDNCPGCYGDGYILVVGPATGFKVVPKACDGQPAA